MILSCKSFVLLHHSLTQPLCPHISYPEADRMVVNNSQDENSPGKRLWKHAYNEIHPGPFNR